MKRNNIKVRQQHIVSFTLFSKNRLDSFLFYKIYNSKRRVTTEDTQWIMNELRAMQSNVEKINPNKSDISFDYKEYCDNYIQNFDTDSVYENNRYVAKRIIDTAIIELENQGVSSIFPISDKNDYINRLMLNYSCLAVFRENWIGDNRIKFSQDFLNVFLTDGLDSLIYEHFNFDHDPNEKYYLPVFDFMKFYEPKADNNEVVLPHYFIKEKAEVLLSALTNKKELFNTNDLLFEYNLMKYLLEQVITNNDTLLIEVNE